MQDLEQYLQVDFLERKVIRTIGIQGRPHGHAWVRDYIVMHGETPSNLAFVSDQFGLPKVRPLERLSPPLPPLACLLHPANCLKFCFFLLLTYFSITLKMCSCGKISKSEFTQDWYVAYPNMVCSNSQYLAAKSGHCACHISANSLIALLAFGSFLRHATCDMQLVISV